LIIDLKILGSGVEDPPWAGRRVDLISDESERILEQVIKGLNKI
jgi:hypothetical protein